MADNEPIIINNATLIWTSHLFTPDTWTPPSGGQVDNRYKMWIMIDKTDAGTVTALRASLAQAAKQAVQEGRLEMESTLTAIQTANAGQSPDGFGYPILDGDLHKRADSNGYIRGHWLVGAKSQYLPRIYDQNGPLDAASQLERNRFHAGAVVNASVKANVYGPSGVMTGGGISLYVQGLQFVSEGTPLDGSQAGASGFTFTGSRGAPATGVGDWGV